MRCTAGRTIPPAKRRLIGSGKRNPPWACPRFFHGLPESVACHRTVAANSRSPRTFVPPCWTPIRTSRASSIRGVRMSFEIERKFLVRDDGWREFVTDQTPIRQAYLASDGKASVRVRIKGDSTATLTIKSRPVDLRRLELEYAIPVLEAEALMQLRQGAVVEKVRHLVPRGDRRLGNRRVLRREQRPRHCRSRIAP